MSVNVGTVDRLLRAGLGVALLYLAFFSGVPLFDGAVAKSGAAIVGAVMLVVATVRICPVYSALGLKTCRDCG